MRLSSLTGLTTSIGRWHRSRRSGRGLIPLLRGNYGPLHPCEHVNRRIFSRGWCAQRCVLGRYGHTALARECATVVRRCKPLRAATQLCPPLIRGRSVRGRWCVCLPVALTPARVGGVLLGDRFYSMVTKHFTILPVQLHWRWADYRTDGLRPRLSLQRLGAEWGRRRNYGDDSKG
jgi:hypothetical protein